MGKDCAETKGSQLNNRTPRFPCARQPRLAPCGSCIATRAGSHIDVARATTASSCQSFARIFVSFVLLRGQRNNAIPRRKSISHRNPTRNRPKVERNYLPQKTLRMHKATRDLCFLCDLLFRISPQPVGVGMDLWPKLQSPPNSELVRILIATSPTGTTPGADHRETGLLPNAQNFPRHTTPKDGDLLSTISGLHARFWAIFTQVTA